MAALNPGMKIRLFKDGMRAATAVVLDDNSILQVYPYHRTKPALRAPMGFRIYKPEYKSLQQWIEDYESSAACYVDKIVIHKK